MTVSFKDLCLDAIAPGAVADFWAAALGLSATLLDNGNARLDGAEPAQTLWINKVPEPKTVKQRVHLDLHTRSIADLVALGATELTPYEHWTVLADPEGGELCGFARGNDVPAYRLYEVIVDAQDPERLCRWWAALLGVEPQRGDSDDEWWVEGGGLPWPVIFGAVPEPKTVKNRIHWDVTGQTEQVVLAGATLLRRADDTMTWDICADPEGNEFCIFA